VNNRPLDASTNGWNFLNNMAAATCTSTDTVSGLLGPGGVMSLASLELGRSGVSGFWGTGYSTPTDKFGIEAWVKPASGVTPAAIGLQNGVCDATVEN
jgi:hypothetical protein